MHPTHRSPSPHLTPTRPSARGWALWCLALALLWAQMGGWLHGLSHSLGELHPGWPAHASVGTSHAAHAEHAHHAAQVDAAQGHADQVCEECLAFAALTLAAPFMQGLSAALPLALAGWHTPLVTRTTASPFLAYRTRAPPR